MGGLWCGVLARVKTYKVSERVKECVGGGGGGQGGGAGRESGDCGFPGPLVASGK